MTQLGCFHPTPEGNEEKFDGERLARELRAGRLHRMSNLRVPSGWLATDGRSRPRRVLVAVALGQRCAVAIRRAGVIARRFNAVLDVVHVLPRGTRVLGENPTLMRAVIARWAFS